MKVALMFLALIGMSTFVVPAHAQTVPVVVGGNLESPPPPGDGSSATLTDSGSGLQSAVPAYADTYFNPYLLLARLQGWIAPAGGPTPTSGMLSARSVRFASAGRPDARVRRVTWW